jgi:hypothetical protein
VNFGARIRNALSIAANTTSTGMFPGQFDGVNLSIDEEDDEEEEDSAGLGLTLTGLWPAPRHALSLAISAFSDINPPPQACHPHSPTESIHATREELPEALREDLPPLRPSPAPHSPAHDFLSPPHRKGYFPQVKKIFSSSFSSGVRFPLKDCLYSSFSQPILTIRHPFANTMPSSHKTPLRKNRHVDWTTAEDQFIRENAHRLNDIQLLAILNLHRFPPLTRPHVQVRRQKLMGSTRTPGRRTKPKISSKEMIFFMPLEEDRTVNQDETEPNT